MTNTTEIDVDAVAEKADKLLYCQVKGCPRVFDTRRGLSNHMSVHALGRDATDLSHVPGYQPPGTIVRPDGKLECAECGRIEKNQKSMGSHKRKHFADARMVYVRELEAAAREVGTLRKTLREMQRNYGATGSTTEAPPVDNGPVLTVDLALEFLRDQVYSADQEIISLTTQLKALEASSGYISDKIASAPSGDATATMELIRDSFLKFYNGDLTMTRFVTEVEDALRLMYPDITEE